VVKRNRNRESCEVKTEVKERVLRRYNIMRFDNHITYVEIKCQLDVTEVFIADLIACSTCFGAPLCPSSGAQEGYVSGLQGAAAS